MVGTGADARLRTSGRPGRCRSHSAGRFIDSLHWPQVSYPQPLPLPRGPRAPVPDRGPAQGPPLLRTGRGRPRRVRRADPRAQLPQGQRDRVRGRPGRRPVPRRGRPGEGGADRGGRPGGDPLGAGRRQLLRRDGGDRRRAPLGPRHRHGRFQPPGAPPGGLPRPAAELARGGDLAAATRSPAGCAGPTRRSAAWCCSTSTDGSPTSCSAWPTTRAATGSPAS